MEGTADLLKALARVKVEFQQRTIETILRGGCVRTWWDDAAGEMRTETIPPEDMGA